MCSMFFAILLMSIVVGGDQAAPASLSETLRAHVKNERFGMVTAIRGLPLGVRDALQTLFGSGTLDIADTGAKFQAPGAIANPALPTRRLVAAGCSVNYCLVHYERGGTALTWHVALFYWTPAETRLEWGGTASSRLTTVEDVRKAVLAGAIKSPGKVW